MVAARLVLLRGVSGGYDDAYRARSCHCYMANIEQTCRVLLGG
jgi:hypothetical protein